MDEYIGDRGYDGMSALSFAQFKQKSQVNLNEIAESWKHTFEIWGTKTKVSTQSLCEYSLHSEKHETMMFLGKYKFVYVFLSFNLALATVYEFKSIASADSRAPRIRFFLSKT